jgi:hypothetical protein
MAYDPSQMMITNKFKTQASTLRFFSLSILYVLLIHTANGKVHHHKFVVCASLISQTLINDGGNAEYL